MTTETAPPGRGQERELPNVVEFLLMSTTFPRSILYCLRSAENELRELEVPGQVSRAQRVLGRRRADLEFSDVRELLSGDMRSYLDQVHDDVRHAANLVGNQFFRHAADFSVFHSLEPVS